MIAAILPAADQYRSRAFRAVSAAAPQRYVSSPSSSYRLAPYAQGLRGAFCGAFERRHHERIRNRTGVGERLQGRTVSRSTRIAAGVIPGAQQGPAVMGLAADVLGGDPGVGRAADPLGRFGRRASFSTRVRRPKKRGSDQAGIVAVFDALHRRRHASDAILYAFVLLELDGVTRRHVAFRMLSLMQTGSTDFTPTPIFFNRCCNRRDYSGTICNCPRKTLHVECNISATTMSTSWVTFISSSVGCFLPRNKLGPAQAGPFLVCRP
jgi:hypothetical protein